MKSLKSVVQTLFTILIILESISSLRKSIRGDTTTITSSTTSSPPAVPDVGQIWDDLFTVPRTTACREEINRARIRDVIAAEDAGRGGVIINDSKFGWIKKWGFGPVAYLMDFWDPLFRKDVLDEFNAIHNSTMHEDPEDTAEYKDVFDFSGRIATAPAEQQAALMKDLKAFENSYDPVIFKLSANSVQIMKAIKNFKWAVDPGMPDYAADFVTRYDMNHDGRLNPKELLLGAIMYNKGVLGSKICNHCFSKIAGRIGALFTYLDCAESGFINADQMWKYLPELRRPSVYYNIFGYGNSENIRTNAINDFVLKNEKAKDAYVSKDEFVVGILLAIWDRQVSDTSIVDDDSRNLKKLRWSDNNMTDTAAYNYVKAITKSKIEDEEKQRFARWERKKAKSAAAAKALFDQQQLLA
jgi:hypothetical protein